MSNSCNPMAPPNLLVKTMREFVLTTHFETVMTILILQSGIWISQMRNRCALSCHFLGPQLHLDLGQEGASLVAQLVKNLPAMQETLVLFQGGEDFLEKG